MSGISKNLFLNRRYDKTAIDKATVAALAAGAGISALGVKLMPTLSFTPDNEEGMQLAEKIKQRALNQGINVADWQTGATNSMYLPKSTYWMMDHIPGVRSLVKRIGDAGGLEIPKAGPAGDAISSFPSGSTIAHELGHAEGYQHRNGYMLGKLSEMTTSPAYLASGLGSMYLGKKVADAEAEGKKVSLARRILAPAVVGAAGYLPSLGREYFATKRGLDILKEEGASQNYLDSARDDLRTALGTYAGDAVRNMGTSILMSEGARAIQAWRLRRRKEKDAQRQAQQQTQPVNNFFI